MNERIRELAKHAGLIAGEHDDLDFKKNLTDKEKKFAELIVRECATMTRNLSPHGELAERAVKEHFGVEDV